MSTRPSQRSIVFAHPADWPTPRISLRFLRPLAIALASLAGAPALSGAQDPSLTLISFDGGFETDAALMQDAKVTREKQGAASTLRVATGHRADWPGITIKAPQACWDLSAYTEIYLQVKNLDAAPVTVYCRVDSAGGDGDNNSLTESVALQPDEQKLLRVQLIRQLPARLSHKLFGMRGYPGGAKEKGLDASCITQLIIFVNKPKQDHVFQLSSIRARGSYLPGDWWKMSPERFFPMIDKFGQFAHSQWPGKTASEGELKQAIQEEQEDLAAHPGPSHWNRYGGWQDGPQLPATGFFHPVKYRGKWWLVDPEGRLFWSHGVDCVGSSQGSTPISEREFLYAELPDQDSPLARFYGRSSWAPHGYYQDKRGYRTFNFAGANLMRKYGDDWYNRAASLTHRRLRSWSMNTIANWSDAGIYLQRKTPYVVSVGSSGTRMIEGSTGYWGKFPDPFDPSFRRALEQRLRGEIGKSAGDPWCIGFFVDNELAWGDEVSLAAAALASPREQAAKKAFLADLQQKYQIIAALNAAWDASHESWDALAKSVVPPSGKGARPDLAAFYRKIAREYFRHCRDAVKQVAPHNLYLGCRFSAVNDLAAEAAAEHCDVVAYNLYRDSVADFQLPNGLDKPVVIGEFHFGALDRGMFHTGLRPTASQADRANAYRNYVNGALRNPALVGTHWFQFGDQATTGRGDGENYQIGLVDICDKPYPETIQAVREVGLSLYKTRMQADATNRPN